MENERFILFLDILGFKDLINKNTTEEIKNIYEQQVIRTIGISIELASRTYGFPISMTHVVNGNILEDTIQDEFEVHIMSDSIIIWTKDVENVTLMKLLGFTSIFLEQTFILGVPLRGAISKGAVDKLVTTVNNNIQSCIVGKGLVNAYQLEGKQNWMGCIVDSNCLSNIPDTNITKLISSKSSSLTKYKVPIKKKNHKGKIVYDSEMNYVINWTNIVELLEKDLKFFQDNFSRFNKDIENNDVKRDR